MNAELLVLRFVHVLGGIFWVGAATFNTFFLLPALATAGPVAGQVMGALQRRRLFTVLPAVAVLTILSGVRLLQITSSGFSAGYFATRSGAAFASSGALAILAFGLGMLLVRPAGVRAGALGQQLAAMPAGPDRDALERTIASLRRRTALGSTVAQVFLTLGAAGMAVARYLG